MLRAPDNVCSFGDGTLSPRAGYIYYVGGPWRASCSKAAAPVVALPRAAEATPSQLPEAADHRCPEITTVGRTQPGATPNIEWGRAYGIRGLSWVHRIVYSRGQIANLYQMWNLHECEIELGYTSLTRMWEINKKPLIF